MTTYLLGVSNRFDDDVPSLDRRSGCRAEGKGRPSVPPAKRVRMRAGKRTMRDAKIQEELMRHLSQEQRQRVVDHMRTEGR